MACLCVQTLVSGSMQIQCVTGAMLSSAPGGYRYPRVASQPCVGNSPAPSKACCRTSSLHR